MIKLSSLSFSYGQRKIIRSVDLDIRDGELTAVVGVNGSGKSTCLRLMAGELTPDQGSVSVDGVEYRTDRRSLSRALSYFPQGRPIPDMIARELVLLGRYPYTRVGIFPKEDENKLVNEAMARAGCSELSSLPLSRMSYGQRQRVYYAMSLIQNTQNALFDEPTTYLDEESRLWLLSSLSELAKEGKCVVAVLHELSCALSFAHRVIVLRDGEIAADGTPGELFSSGKLEELFSVRICAVPHNGSVFYTVLPK